MPTIRPSTSCPANYASASRATATRSGRCPKRQAADHAGRHLVGAADQGHANRRLRPRRAGRARFAQGRVAQRPANRTDPQRAHGGQEKVDQFDRNLIEAMAIVVLVALVFMEWRSALLVAVSIPLTVAMTLGHLPTAGHRPATGVDCGHDHRPGAAGRRSGGGRRRHQSRDGPRAPRATWPPGSARKNWPAPSSTPR